MCAARGLVGNSLLSLQVVSSFSDVTNGWKNHIYEIVLRSDDFILDKPTSRAFMEDLRYIITFGLGGVFR